ncbi:intracellular protein transport protein USO1-like [Cryptomeria japonica]|uniref:intracellular protein transport protein USO1-like n=1 Tax=Cryptomeria japonica TaxID=3369 RepID=UPI0027DA4755|nr:intracellular protein transport protein USO1-like [Cryptomeria japonica]
MTPMDMDEEYYLDEELKTTLENLESVESENEDLKENVKVEESTKVEETLKDIINLKTKEHGKLEQELLKVKNEAKVSESGALLDKLLSMQKSHKDKEGLGSPSECFNEKSKGKGKIEDLNKLEDSNKVWNPRPTIKRPLIQQPNAQSRQVKVNETMIAEATGLPMDGIKFYRDRKLFNAAVKKFRKDEEEKAKLVKGSHTYYSPRDAISNPKTNPAIHEGLIVILYNHIKNTTIHLNIVEVSELQEELKELDDDDDGEGYDTEADVEDDPQITRSSKRRRKTRKENQRKGSAKMKQKGEDDDSWYEEEDETGDVMDTESEEVQILSSQKHKRKTLKNEDVQAKNRLPFLIGSKDKVLAREDIAMKEAKSIDVREVGLEVNLDPVGDKVQEGSHLDIDLCIKNGTNSFNKVFLWVQKEIASIKANQTQEASKIETLEAIGTGKLNSLPNCLSELTKTISNAEDIINAQHSSFQILENRAGAIEKRLEGVENMLKKIGEQGHKILKATSASMKVLISKIDSDQGDKALANITKVKEDTFEDKEISHGRRTCTSTRKKKSQSREIEEIK